MSLLRHGLLPPRVLCLLVFALALAPRLALVFRAPAFIIGDSENYFFPGYQLARQIGFDLDLRRTPGYPLFVAFVVSNVAEDLSALLLAQHVLGALGCAGVALLGTRLYGRLAGLLAGLACAVASPLIVSEHFVMAEALFVPLSVLVALAACWSIERPGWPRGALAGLLIGVAALTRPVALVLAVAYAVALYVRERSLRRFVVRVAPAALAIAVLLIPWMARNALVHGNFSADGNGGQTLVGRAMRHDRGFAFENPDDPDPARQRARALMRQGRGGFVSPVRERIQRELGLSEAQANRLMRDLAVEAILRQPLYYVTGSLGSFWRLASGVSEDARTLWAYRRDARNREEWEGHIEIRHLLGPPTPLQEGQLGEALWLFNLFQPGWLGPLLPILAIAGVVAGWRSPARGPATFLALAVLGYLGAAAALVAPLPRYGYPAVPWLLLLAAGGSVGIPTIVRDLRRRGRPTATSTA
ncbi:MAG: glycosyltransferase family 39 protein [Chloroflexota bacterium]